MRLSNLPHALRGVKAHKSNQVDLFTLSSCLASFTEKFMRVLLLYLRAGDISGFPKEQLLEVILKFTR
jgi:hypothetical protein